MKLKLSPYLLLQTLFVVPAIALSLVTVSPPEVIGQSTPLSTTQSQKLTLGKTISRSINSGESHDYAIALEKGQFFHAVVNQEGVDVKVSLLGDNRQVIQRSDSPNGLHGPEPMSFTAKESGVYFLRVEQLTKTAGGNYSLMLKELRLTLEGDRDRIKAERALMAGTQLSLTDSLEGKQKALEKLEIAFPVFFANKNSYAAALTRINIGIIYDSLGKKEKAFRNYIHASMFFKYESDRLGEAIALSNIGSILHSLGDKEKALSFYNQALTLFKAVGNPYGGAETLNNIGSVYDSLGDREKALSFYNQALPLFKAVSNRYGEAATLNNIGTVYSSLGNKEKALSFYNQALPLLKAVGNREGESITLELIAYLLAGKKQSALAIVFYKRSVNLTEALRADIQGLGVDLRHSFTESVSYRYRQLADLLLQQDRVLEAQEVLDLLKVQELDEYLQNVRGNETTHQGLTILQSEREILKQFDESQKIAIEIGNELAQLIKISNTATLTSAQSKRLAQLVTIEESLNIDFNNFRESPEVIAAIEQLSRTAKDQRLQLKDLNALRDDLQRLDAVLLYPLILDDRLELVITTPNSAPVRRTVTVPKLELTRAITDYRLALQDPNNPNLKPLAQKLYSWLVEPIEEDLKKANTQTIIYSPDGQLRYLPLSALHDRKQWLVERFQINNITAKSLTNFTPSIPKPMKVVAGAFATDQYRHQFTVGDRIFDFGGLPAAGFEVAQLVASIPNTVSFLDQDFSLEALKPQMKIHNIIHLATHAAFVPGQPQDSFILFGNGDLATLKDIGSWSLSNIDLVVLSACETGLGGTFGNGEEFLGLGYQFQNRGAKATIASLWTVDDGGTQVLMNEFYNQLKTGRFSRNEALRQAQIALIRNNLSPESLKFSRGGLGPSQQSSSREASIDGYSHPRYWAPFILIGNGF